LLHKIVHEEPATTTEWSRLPDRVKGVVLSALSKDPADRPPSAPELWRQLCEAVEPEALSEFDSVAATFSSVSEELLLPPIPKRRRSPATRVMAAATVGSVLAAAVAVLVLVSAPDTAWVERDQRRDAPAAVVQRDMAAFSLDAGALATVPDAIDAGALATVPAAEVVVAKAKVTRSRPHPTRRRGYGCLVIQTHSEGRPLWAEAYVDGKHVGQTALILKKVRAGRHLIVVSRRGFRRISRWVRVEIGTCKRLKYELRAD
jgi:hypothetical protein